MLRNFLILVLFFILISSSAPAMQEVGEDGKPVYNDPPVMINDAGSRVSLPPGLEYCKVVSKEKGDLPEDIADMVVEDNNTGDGGDDLPEDVADFLDEGNNTELPPDMVTATSPSETAGHTGSAVDISSTDSIKSTVELDDTGKKLLMVLASLIFILIILLFYLFSKKKEKNLVEIEG